MSNKYEPVSYHHQPEQYVFLVAIGAIIGFSNIWKFPYLMSQNGGLLFWCLCAVSVRDCLAYALSGLSLDVLRGAIPSVRRSCSRPDPTSKPSLANIRLVFTAGRFYCAGVLCRDGWDGTFLRHCFCVWFFNGQTAEAVRDTLGILQHSPLELCAWHSLFMLFVVVIVSRGVKRWVGSCGKAAGAHHVLPFTCFVYREFLYGDLASSVEYLFRLEPRSLLGIFL